MVSKLITRRRSLVLPAAAVGVVAAPAIVRAAWPNSGKIYPPTANSASSFNPTSLITGAGGFWRADMGVSLSGSFVTAWADQTSFANNFGTFNNTTTFSATGFNASFPGLIFVTSAAQGGNLTISFNSTTVSLFMLAFLTGAITDSTNRLCALSASGQADFSSQSTILLYGSGGGFRPFASNTNTPGVTGATVGNGGSADGIATNNPYLLGSVFDGANGNSWVNGSVVGSGTAFTASIGGGASAILYTGATPNGQNAGFNLAFMGLTQKAMNSTDWTNLKNWSNSNWGTSF